MHGKPRRIDWTHSNRPWFIGAALLALATLGGLVALGRPLLGLGVGAAIALWPFGTWLQSRTLQGMDQTFDSQIAARQRRHRRESRTPRS